MAPTASELIKRAFASFEVIAKRDTRAPGAVEVDLGKVATEIAKAASTFGAQGDVDALEKSIDELGALLEKSTYDATTDKVYSAATELAKRVAVTKAESAPQYTHEGGAPTPPAKGSKEQKQNEYTAEAGLANEKGEQYTESASASVATTPSGGPAIGFDQPAGGPAMKAATAKAAAPAAKPTRTNEGAAEASTEDAEPAISEGKQGRRATKRTETAKSAHVTTEELWARDMAAMTVSEVSEVRKAAKKQAMVDGEVEKDCGDTAPIGTATDDAPDDRTAMDAKAKAKAKKKATKKDGAEGGPTAGGDSVNEVDPEVEKAEGDAEEEAAESDDEEAAEGDDAKDKKPFPPKKGKTAKADESGEAEWPSDLSPANSPVEKAQRLPVGHIGARANGARAVEKRHAEIRKAALEPEEIPGDELSPDQVAELQKRAKLTPAQRRRENTKRLKTAGYVAGSRELEVEGIDEAAVASDDEE